jgi:hypothetical protein
VFSHASRFTHHVPYWKFKQRGKTCPRTAPELSEKLHIGVDNPQCQEYWKHVMKSRSPANTPLLRSVAAATLLVWIGALVSCAEICSSTGSAADSETSHRSDRHAEAADSHHHHGDSSEPSHHGPCGSVSCLTHKQALLTSKAPPAFHPALVPLYTLSALTLPLNTADAPIHATLRQTKPRDWVFTPEVCLGPAFHSLAPPSLHLA